MPRILILSSVVAMGHVGLSAGQPVCQRLGVEVTGLPTVLLSNHPGWPHVAGAPVPAAQIEAQIGALAANGWLAGHDALLVGYLPTVAHVDMARGLIQTLRQAAPAARVVLDPVLGDRPKGLYLPQEVAEAIRSRLLPLADVATPNHFELEWLTQHNTETLAGVEAAARALGPGTVHVTSPPLGAGATGVLSVTDGGAQLFRTDRYPRMPQGTGDAFAAMIAAGLPVGQALGHLRALAKASQSRDHLDIVGGNWADAAPVLPE